MNKSKNKKESFDFSTVGVIKITAIYGGIGAIITLLCTILFAFLLSSKDLPTSVIQVFSVISLAAGGFCGGFLLAKRIKKRGALLGLFVGLFLFLVTFIAGFFFPPVSFSVYAVVKNVILFMCSAIGGVFGVNLKKKEKI